MVIQRNLFRLPSPKRYRPTPQQLAMLDFIAWLNGKPPSIKLRLGATGLLRRLIREELVICVALGPARYRLTEYGRLVRMRGRP